MPVSYLGWHSTGQDCLLPRARTVPSPPWPWLHLQIHAHSKLPSGNLNPSFHGSQDSDTHGPGILSMDPQSSCLYVLLFLKPASYPAPPIPASVFTPITLQSGKRAMERSFTTPSLLSPEGCHQGLLLLPLSYLYFSLFSFPHLSQSVPMSWTPMIVRACTSKHSVSLGIELRSPHAGQMFCT